MEPVYSVKGVGGILEVYDNKVDITPKGILGAINKGLKGTKSISFSSITAIQLKKTGFTNGYIQFTVPGGVESKGGAIAAQSDENSFVFGQKNKQMEEIKAYIEDKIAQLHSTPNASKGSDIASELSKLAELKQQGNLSEKEFQAAKSKLLGS
jgi:hypothetical protein